MGKRIDMGKRIASREIEVPIKVRDARIELGVGKTYMTQLMGQMGLKNVRRIKLSRIVKWLDENPNFKVVHPNRPHVGQLETAAK